jgi:hypothetical protein
MPVIKVIRYEGDGTIMYWGRLDSGRWIEVYDHYNRNNWDIFMDEAFEDLVDEIAEEELLDE